MILPRSILIRFFAASLRMARIVVSSVSPAISAMSRRRREIVTDCLFRAISFFVKRTRTFPVFNGEKAKSPLPRLRIITCPVRHITRFLDTRTAKKRGKIRLSEMARALPFNSRETNFNRKIYSAETGKNDKGESLRCETRKEV